MKIEKFKGLGVVVITPFLTDGSIDFNSLSKLVENYIEEGVDYLLALGTNSETPTLSESEKKEILKTIININKGRVPLLAGLGSPCTSQLIDHLKNDDFTGIDALLSVTPYYNKPNNEGLYEHFSQLAYYSPLPIILYNVPKRTGCDMDADIILKIANDNAKIIGIKEASGNMNHIMKLIKHKPDDFLIISGDDAITLPLLSIGIDGLISVIANAFPKLTANMIHLAMEGNFNEAKIIHEMLLDIMQASFKEGNPAGIKAILALQGKILYYMRLPLTRISFELQIEIKKLLQSIYL